MARKGLLVVKGDSNDADYVTESSDITSAPAGERGENREEYVRAMLAIVIPLLKAKGGQWPHEHGDETLESIYGPENLEMLEFFDGFAPHGEHGVHSIESVKILVVESEEVLF